MAGEDTVGGSAGASWAGQDTTGDAAGDDSEAVEYNDEVEALTKEEEAMLKEVNYDDDGDIEAFLKDTENPNTRRQTEACIGKYNRLMSLVYKKEGKEFVPLENTPTNEIPGRLARFFRIVRTGKGEVFNASSYTTFLCCFSRYLADAFDPPIDLKNDASFKILREMVKRMKIQAQRTKGKKPGDNAPKVVTAHHLRQAWVSGSLGREDPEALAAAAYLVATVGFGCRALEEVRNINNGAINWGQLDPHTQVQAFVTFKKR